jgi:glycerol-3-phosphate dehydrogenase (NAD(P)+)
VTIRVAVVGAGSWGTSLAALLAKNGHEVVLWALEPDVVEQITERHENRRFLPGIRLPDTLRATGDLADAFSRAEVAVNVVPSQFAGRVMADAAPHVGEGCQLVSASKGIETATLRRMDEVLMDALGERRMKGFTVLSGPSFALEVAHEAPTAVVAASVDPAAAERVQRLFQNRFFRVYTNPDVVGVELGGALKNVIALAAGMSSGLGFGHNTLVALITRGLAEMARLGQAMGAQLTTFAGLAGMGDLVLTCTGELSRNRTVGVRLGRGESLASILEEMSAVAEGVKTAQAAHDLAAREGVEMPITSEVRAILVDGRDPREALWSLMQRGPKPEEWS